jgi:hypothetical protein
MKLAARPQRASCPRRLTGRSWFHKHRNLLENAGLNLNIPKRDIGGIMRKIVFVAILLAANTILDVPTGSAQYASPQCQECRNACVNTRVTCKSSACRSAGGQDNGPSACSNVKDDNKFVQGLVACERAEGPCWDRCAATAPGCR